MATYRDRKLEFLVVAVILGVLMVFLLNALERIQREIEEASVLSEVSALRVELLDRLSHHEAVGGRLPQGDNPVVWAGRQPVAYVGELSSPPMERGVWYYHTAEKVLIYRFRGEGEMKFRLVRTARQLGAPAVLGGVGLVRVDDGASAK